MARKRRAKKSGAGLAGVGILVLGGLAIWAGAVLVDGGMEWPARSLETTGVDGEDDARERAIPAPGSRIRVEVLNAGGVRGAAARATEELRDAGFDVVFYGNARTFGEEASKVIDRSGSIDDAAAVARALAIDEVSSEPDTTLLVDVTVLLGSAWASRDARGAAPDPDEPNG